MSLRVSVEQRHLILSTVILVSLISGISAFGHALESQPSQSSEAIPRLIEAIWGQDLERVKRLLSDGADPDAKTTITIVGRDRPAWGWAITARDEVATELLLSKVKTVDRAEGLLVAAHRN